MTRFEKNDADPHALSVFTVPYGYTNVTLLPSMLLEAVLPMAPLLPIYGDNKAVEGAFMYREDMVPVINLSILSDPKSPIEQEKRHLVIIRSVSKNSSINYYAFIASATVQNIQITPDMLEEVEDKELSETFYSKIRLTLGKNVQMAHIFDIEKMEQTLFPLTHG